MANKNVFKSVAVKAVLEGSASFGGFTAKRVLTANQFGNKPWRVDWFKDGKKVAKKEAEKVLSAVVE